MEIENYRALQQQSVQQKAALEQQSLQLTMDFQQAKVFYIYLFNSLFCFQFK